MSGSTQTTIQAAIASPCPSGPKRPQSLSKRLSTSELGKDRGRSQHKPGIVHTTEFHDWFDGSVVVDDAKTAMLTYHGTVSSTKAFTTRGTGWYAQLGFWFYAGKTGITKFVDGQRPSDYSRMIAAYLSIKRPKEFASMEDLTKMANEKWGWTLSSRMQRLRTDLLKEGYDGVVVRNNRGTGGVVPDSWVTFRNGQIVQLAEETSAS